MWSHRNLICWGWEVTEAGPTGLWGRAGGVGASYLGNSVSWVALFVVTTSHIQVSVFTQTPTMKFCPQQKGS